MQRYFPALPVVSRAGSVRVKISRPAVMDELPEGSYIIFLTNAAYIQNFDREPGPKSANSDLILQCIESKKRHSSVSVKIVPYHKSPLLIETHDTSTEAMKQIREAI